MRTSAILALILILTAALRITTFPIPLERDEGEYAYAGQLILEGIPPYGMVCNMKLPGTYAAHALNMAVFGQTIEGVHAGLLVWNLVGVLFLFLIARRLFGDTGGLVAAASYAWLSVCPSVMGTASHATQYVVPCALGGLYVLLRAENSSRLAIPFWGGFLLGLAFLMKQHGVLFAMFGGLYLVWLNRSRLAALPRQIATLAAGFLLPFAITCLIVWRAGVFERFWFWTFTYARAYATERGLHSGWLNFSSTFGDVFAGAPALFILAFIGLLILWTRKDQTDRALYCTALLACSFVAMSPGLVFREHYFVLLLPAVALLAAAAIALAPAKLRLPWPAVAFVVLLGISVYQQENFFFEENSIAQSRDVWSDNPFPEAIKLAEYIKAHTSPDARIAVLGSEPEIYFYSHRRSATRYIYTYSILEHQPYADQMAGELIGDIVGNHPEYIVYISSGSSWGRDPKSGGTVFDWWRSYSARYDVVGVADILEDHTEYKWDADAAAYKIQSDNYATVLKRKP